MDGIKIVATNRKAYHEYYVEDTYEAGLALIGSEVKSLRLGNASFTNSYIVIENNTATVLNLHIAQYTKGSVFNPPPTRNRQLLLHKREIIKLRQAVERKGYALIPLKLYFKRGLCKLEIGLCKGKHLYDKREALMEKDLKRRRDREDND